MLGNKYEEEIMRLPLVFLHVMKWRNFTLSGQQKIPQNPIFKVINNYKIIMINLLVINPNNQMGIDKLHFDHWKNFQYYFCHNNIELIKT